MHVRVVTGTAVDRPLLDSGNGWSISDFAAGLHREGSKAVFRYTSLELADRFALLNAAFGEEGYKVEGLEVFGCQEDGRGWKTTEKYCIWTFFYPKKNAIFVEVSIVIGSAIGLP